MKIEFTVAASNPSNEGKTHVWKLFTNIDVVAFGVKKTIKRTFYIGNMPIAGVVGTKIVEDIAKFDIVERPFVIEEIDETSGEAKEEVIMLKWLHIKVAV